jgi:hypothetical protein
VFVSLDVEGFASGRGQPEDGAPLCGNGTSTLGNTTVMHGSYTAYAAWATPNESLAGYFNANGSFDVPALERMDRPNYPVDVWDGIAGGLWMQRVKQLLIAQGVAVLCVNPYAVDSMDAWPGSWEVGLDRPFYTELLRRLRAGDLGPLDAQRLVFRGYSAGAQMISWLAELYAQGDAAVSGTTMVGGVLISGGTYACYGLSNATDGTAAIGSCSKCDASQHCRNTNCSNTAPVPCCDFCCPQNYTEAWYEAHPATYSTHPASFLAQLSTWDQNADLCAAKNYHETLLRHGARSQLVLVDPEDEDCFCIGNPNGPDPNVSAVASESPYSHLCVGGSTGSRFKCGQHALAFAGMVGPLVEWTLDLVHGRDGNHKAI